MLDVSA